MLLILIIYMILVHILVGMSIWGAIYEGRKEYTCKIVCLGVVAFVILFDILVVNEVFLKL